MRKNRLERDHGRIAAGGKVAVLVEDVGNSARHTTGEIATRAAEHHYGTARHVFTTVVAGALDHSDGARIAYRKALAGDAVEVGLAFGCSIHNRVADDDVLWTEAAEIVGRTHDDASPGQTLARVVVGIADQVKRDAAGQKSAEALAGGSLQLDVNRVVRQFAMTIA